MLSNALVGVLLVKIRGVFMFIWVGGSLHNVILSGSLTQA